MKKITLLLLTLLTASLGYAQTSNYCSTEVFHLNDPAQTASPINLTIVNTGATTVKVTAAAADITFLDLVGITGLPIKSAPDTSVSGEISITLTWAPASPSDVTIQFLQWRKTSTGAATWQIDNATFPSAGTCTPPTEPEEDASLSDLTVNGTTVAGFDAGTLTYNVALPNTDVPTVAGTATQDGNASSNISITQASAIPGSAIVVVTAPNGTDTQTYTLNFTVNTNTACAGVSSEVQQGTIPNAYNYAFETLTNGDVRMTFELPGVNDLVAYSWKESPFAELSMTVAAGTNIATIDLTGYTAGDDISHGVKFVWAAGGFAVTKYFTYTVGDACTLGTEDFAITSFKAYPNPTQDSWTVRTENSNMSSIKVFDILGKNVLSLAPNASETVINGSSLKSGLYFAQIKTETGINSIKLIKN